MAAKRKYEVRTSLRGTLVFPHFNVPDSKFTKPGNRPDYRGKLRVAKDEFESSGWKKFLDDQAAAAIDNATDQDGNPLSAKNRRLALEKNGKPTLAYAIARDKDDNELPYYDVSFKISDGGLDPKTGEEYSNKPKQFDTSKPPKPVDIQLRNGTEVKISYTVFPWATAALGYGVTLRPKAIQIYKLAPQGSADASFYGFDGDDDEGGFKSDVETFGSDDYSSGSDAGSTSGAGIGEDEDIPF
ncbi:hypothetical protein ACXHXM_34050